mgnify:CR=1 FL=1|jgi:hypothetical protein
MEKKYNFYNKDLIGHTEIRNLDCFYFTRYYPTSKYGYNENQEFIFDFKEGVCPEIYAQIFSRTILKLFGNLVLKSTKENLIEKTIILPVPASTQEKQKKRYKELFKLISEKTGVGNGYEYIKIKNDVEAKHLSNNRTSLDEHIEIDYSFLKEYRYIILIDDVITTGKTISELASKFRNIEILQKYVPNSEMKRFIVGMTLAKTFSHLDLLNEELIDEKIVSDPNSTFKSNSFNNFLKLDPIDIIKGIDTFFYTSFGISDIKFKDEVSNGNITSKEYIKEYYYLTSHNKFSILNEQLTIVNKN